MELPQADAPPLQPLPGENGEQRHSSWTIVQQLDKESKEGVAASEYEQWSDAELTSRVETMLLERIRVGDKAALFQLGQLYFETGNFEKAKAYFERADSADYQSLYQLAVILFDGLAGASDYTRAVELMKKIAESKASEAQHLKYACEYNIGRAYFQGYGVRINYAEAERWWLMAADDGNPRSSVHAQSMLGMFYSRPDSMNLKKAFFWHSEACGNGSLESQGALGIMYLHGMGVKKDLSAAFECLAEASQRGNVYAMGHLVAFYYRSKLFTKCADLAARVSRLSDVDEIAAETLCLPSYIRKGISMACFYYARCLQKGISVSADAKEAASYYSKAYHFDPDTCANLQNVTTLGGI